MNKCYIVSGFNPIIKEKYDGFLIGVDKGCLLLAKNGIFIDVGIGDFDSVSSEEFEIIKRNCKKLIKLSPKKDDTDFEHALNYVKKLGYKDIEVYGILGGRQDHNLLNIKLLYLSELNLTYYDLKNKIYCLNAGKHTIYKNDYKYLSFMSFKKSIVSITGTRYELKNTIVDINDNYTTSNEIIKDSCELEIKEGRLLIIQTND